MVSAYQGTLYSLSTYYHLVGVGISLPTYSSDINVEIHDDVVVTRREYIWFSPIQGSRILIHLHFQLFETPVEKEAEINSQTDLLSKKIHSADPSV